MDINSNTFSPMYSSFFSGLFLLLILFYLFGCLFQTSLPETNVFVYLMCYEFHPQFSIFSTFK